MLQKCGIPCMPLAKTNVPFEANSGPNKSNSWTTNMDNVNLYILICLEEE